MTSEQADQIIALLAAISTTLAVIAGCVIASFIVALFERWKKPETRHLPNHE